MGGVVRAVAHGKRPQQTQLADDIPAIGPSVHGRNLMLDCHEERGFDDVPVGYGLQSDAFACQIGVQ